MAGTLLHIVLAERALDRAALPASTKQEMRNSISDFRLGAVLFDLPYYENLVTQAFLRAVLRDYRFNAWGETLHVRSPSMLCRRLLELASSPPFLALALGCLTHAAVDVVFHPEIERRVSLSPRGRTCPNRTHSEIETQMDICIHKHLLGHAGIGTPYTREVLFMVPERGWAKGFQAAVLDGLGKAPSLRRMNGWLRGLRLFAVSHANSRFFWVPSEGKPDAELNAAALRLAEDSIERASRYLEAGFEYRQGVLSEEQFHRVVPDLDLTSGEIVCPFPITRMQGLKNHAD